MEENDLTDRVKKEEVFRNEVQQLVSNEPNERPQVLVGRTYKIKTNCGNCYITVNHIGGEDTPDFRIVEVFATLGKSGGCATALLQGLTRTVSLSLRSGIPEDKVVKMLKGVGCPSPFYGNPILGKGIAKSCIDAVARVLDLEVVTNKKEVSSGTK